MGKFAPQTLFLPRAQWCVSSCIASRQIPVSDSLPRSNAVRMTIFNPGTPKSRCVGERRTVPPKEPGKSISDFVYHLPGVSKHVSRPLKDGDRTLPQSVIPSNLSRKSTFRTKVQGPPHLLPNATARSTPVPWLRKSTTSSGQERLLPLRGLAVPPSFAARVGMPQGHRSRR